MSVLAMNKQGESPAVALADNGGRYTIGSLVPPDQESIKVKLEVDTDYHLVANISWLSYLNYNHNIGGFNVTVTHDDKPADGYPE